MSNNKQTKAVPCVLCGRMPKFREFRPDVLHKSSVRVGNFYCANPQCPVKGLRGGYPYKVAALEWNAWMRGENTKGEQR